MNIEKLMRACASAVMVFASVLCGAEKVAAAGLTAEQVAQKAAAVIAGSKGLSVTFSVTANGRKAEGSVKSAGKKFAVTFPEGSTWYNGKALYTYNPRTAETTVTVPTAQELVESNPLLYVNGGGNNFIYRFSTVKRAGKYVVDLLPKNKKGGIRKMTFTVNSSNFHVERISVEASGGTTSVVVKTFRTGVQFPASEFEYPRSHFPKAEIIDLR